MKKPTLIALLLAPAAPSPAQTATEIDQLCAANPGSNICGARERGKGKSDNLADRVKVGEGWGMTAVTRSEVAQCWGIWKALREHIAANGRGTFPVDYTVANIDKRIVSWTGQMDKSYADPEIRHLRPGAERDALAEARTNVAGPRIVTLAEFSGMCKAMPRPGS